MTPRHVSGGRGESTPGEGEGESKPSDSRKANVSAGVDARRYMTSTLVHHLGDGHELATFRLVTNNQPVHRLDRLRAIGAEPGMPAVMKQNHVPAADLSGDSLLDEFRRRRVPVVTGHIPHDGFESKLPHHAENPRPPSAPRRAKEIRLLADSVADRLSALQDFLMDARGWLKNKPRMGEGMIADHVAAPRNFLHNIRPLPHEASNQKESGPHVVLAQHIQQPQSVRIIRSVVKGERNLFGSAPQPAECAAKPLASRGHGLVSHRNSARCSAGCDGKAQHGEIVNAIPSAF